MSKYLAITAISDLHGHHPRDLLGGDLLIICGDITASDKLVQWHKFYEWLRNQQYRKKVLIGGNHDRFLSQFASSQETRELFEMFGNDPDLQPDDDFEYLLDSGCEFEGLKIWGSPWSLSFEGINPHCRAFTGTDGDLRGKFDLIPDDVDILISLAPPFGTLDVNKWGGRCGSKALADRILDLKKLRLHFFGHIHESYGSCHAYYSTPDARNLDEFTPGGHLSVNCSIMNANYSPVNGPFNIEIKEKE